MYIKMRYERVLVISDEHLRYRELTECLFKKSKLLIYDCLRCSPTGQSSKRKYDTRHIVPPGMKLLF